MKWQLHKKLQSDTHLTAEQVELSQKFSTLVDEASKIILDKRDAIEVLVVGLMSKGHILIEDVPGVGKTTLAQTIAKFLGLHFNRIQFTNDLLPSDILGNMIFNPQKSEFYFHQGALFAEMVLGDELNRANSKTQSALLEALEENQVTVDAKAHPLPKPFFFVATQNPRFQVGTFPLPESQLDRFLLSLDLDYASKQGEMKIFMGYDSRSLLPKIQALVTKDELLQSQVYSQQIYVSEKVAEYIYDLVQNSRTHSELFAPLSTRAGLALVRASQAFAFLQGRGFLIPEDVQRMAPYVLSHRLGLQDGVKMGQNKTKLLLEKTELKI